MGEPIRLIRDVITLLYTIKTFEKTETIEALPLAIDLAIGDLKSAIQGLNACRY